MYFLKVVVWGQNESNLWVQIGNPLDAGEAVTAVAVSMNTSCLPWLVLPFIFSRQR